MMRIWWSISRQFPAFKGRLEFELTFELFGKRVTRQARVDYSYTPDWEYWDLHKKAPFVGWRARRLPSPRAQRRKVEGTGLAGRPWTCST
jgi:hypothetical protein